ncbi:MAG: cupin domain-containing protein [Actinobacteria bacterium]|nr:cupin domain-containing protein [Actinomycetota bacterium]
MPRTRKDEAPIALDHPVIEGRYVELDGYTVSFESFHVDADATPLFVGLPDDRCQCPHWGVVVSGAVTVRYAGGEETFRAGDAYYMRPGHVNEVTAGTEVVEFSPTAELQKTMAVMGENMAKAEAAS